ncbi:ComEB Deoxycytidylate deaminase [uncultured Caudovirales phage]|uniref:ComEB Deoxycytidylate deaminase n=1 Tax=uncultured Caudovirales phage TaxID=2100421 RepID=A0A6J5MA07_9CAUD|nr:ComEB Deoxycytidylate deaminase [uncultured Caudovirales phage]
MMRDRRPTKDEWALALAKITAARGTCARRQVGCVLLNHRGHVLSTGYNGKAAGSKHCLDVPCPGAGLPSGTGLDLCEAIHAEQNALLQCPDVYDIRTCYVTTSPCVHCVKLLMNTGCRRIVFLEAYAHADEARRMWQSEGQGRVWGLKSPPPRTWEMGVLPQGFMI